MVEAPRPDPAAYEIGPPLRPLQVELSLPGSKSYTNRALICAALAEGESVLRHASLSDDSHLLISALQSLGFAVSLAAEEIRVGGRGTAAVYFEGEIDVGAAGTAMRFLTAFCALLPGCRVLLKGSARMHERPIGPLVTALSSLGAQIEYRGRPDCPPLYIVGQKAIGPKRVLLAGDTSSQFFSALLLSAPLIAGGLSIEVQGTQASASYIDMTLETLKDFGVTAMRQDYRCYFVAPQSEYRAGTYRVAGDASGASYLWGAAAISGGLVRVSNISPNSNQGDLGFLPILAAMGCQIRSDAAADPPGIEVQGPARLKAVVADMSSMPDTAQTLAVLAACAEGESLLTGLATLRHKETDRVAAVAAELTKVGIKVEAGNDWLRVVGGQPRRAAIDTYDDHRMAMAFALLGLRHEGIVIKDPGVVSKSFPSFWECFAKLGASLQCG